MLRITLSELERSKNAAQSLLYSPHVVLRPPAKCGPCPRAPGPIQVTLHLVLGPNWIELLQTSKFSLLDARRTFWVFRKIRKIRMHFSPCQQGQCTLSAFVARSHLGHLYVEAVQSYYNDVHPYRINPLLCNVNLVIYMGMSIQRAAPMPPFPSNPHLFLESPKEVVSK